MASACRSVVTVDIDAPEAPRALADAWLEYIRWRAVRLGASSVYCAGSPSGRGYHCTVCFPAELGDEERLVLAAALGDDPARVLFGLERLASRGRLNDILFIIKERLLRDSL